MRTRRVGCRQQKFNRPLTAYQQTWDIHIIDLQKKHTHVTTAIRPCRTDHSLLRGTMVMDSTMPFKPSVSVETLEYTWLMSWYSHMCSSVCASCHSHSSISWTMMSVSVIFWILAPRLMRCGRPFLNFAATWWLGEASLEKNTPMQDKDRCFANLAWCLFNISCVFWHHTHTHPVMGMRDIRCLWNPSKIYHKQIAVVCFIRVLVTRSRSMYTCYAIYANWHRKNSKSLWCLWYFKVVCQQHCLKRLIGTEGVQSIYTKQSTKHQCPQQQSLYSKHGHTAWAIRLC